MKCCWKIGFPANETFREKMRKFSFAFRKLFRENKYGENETKFREILIFFAFRKLRKYFRKMRKFRENAKCENFVKTMSVIAATINCSKELVKFSALIP